MAVISISMRMMALGAIVSCAGIIIAATGRGTPGAIVTLAGWLAFVYGIHRFGRAG